MNELYQNYYSSCAIFQGICCSNVRDMLGQIRHHQHGQKAPTILTFLLQFLVFINMLSNILDMTT